MISDTHVRDSVQAELDWDTRVDSRQIGVAVKNGVVTLTGHVSSYLERREAEEAAQAVDGVKAVANDITVDLPLDFKRSDSEVAQTAVDALNFNVAVPANSVKVSVSEGWLTLKGELPTWHQKMAAEQALVSLRGVKGITNNITVRPEISLMRPPISVHDVQKKITEALHRRAQLDATNIRVSAAEGTVTLEGQVDSWRERNQAETAAWQAPGVSNVIDHLTVRP